MPKIWFDDSFPALVRTLGREVDVDFVSKGTALRDISGRLTFFAGRPATSEEERARLKASLEEALGPYARPDRPIVFSDEPGAQAILASPDRLRIQIEGVLYQLLDRRIVGSGWLEVPALPPNGPPRIAFATLKGGVGRSTALAVAAADLARRNQNVLVIDLDLEAPGIGTMILNDDRLPEFGAVDFLVENGLGGISDRELNTFVGTSALTAAGGGRVDVVPAVGRRSTGFPENILPKLSRSMLDDLTEGGNVPMSAQVSSMIDRIAQASGYDVILVDSRAGLSELAAPAVIGLGATVLLFGTAQKQTIEGYRALFAGLHLLAQRDRTNGDDADWRAALRPVYAKATLNPEVSRRFQDEVYELYSAYLYDEEESGLDSADSFRYVRDDEKAPHWPMIIPYNSTFVDFDPSRFPGQLDMAFYEQTYRAFLDRLDEVIQTSASRVTS